MINDLSALCPVLKKVSCPLFYRLLSEERERTIQIQQQTISVLQEALSGTQKELSAAQLALATERAKQEIKEPKPKEKKKQTAK